MGILKHVMWLYGKSGCKHLDDGNVILYSILLVQQCHLHHPPFITIFMGGLLLLYSHYPAGRSYGCAGMVRRTCSGQGIASGSLSLCWCICSIYMCIYIYITYIGMYTYIYIMYIYIYIYMHITCVYYHIIIYT